MFSKIAVVSAAFGIVALPQATHGYPAVGPYMPVSDIKEHMDMYKDVRAFNEALKGDNPDYAKAKEIYMYGIGESCKSATKGRTLQGFAQADLTGESYYDTFIKAGREAKYWDTWMLAFLDGTGDMAGLSRVKRVTSLKKGVLGLMTHYASHELEAAIVKATDTTRRNDKGSAHAWDEGWAFYYGDDSAGKDSAWEVAMKRDGDFPDGAKISTKIDEQFNRGLIAVREATYNDADAKAARDSIYRMWTVTYLRAALKYLEVSEAKYDDKAHAEGYAYFLPIFGLVHDKDAAAAKELESALDITKTTIAAGTFCKAKAAVEKAYPALGLSCDSVGTYKSSSITGCACSGSTGAIDTTGAVGPVTAVTGDFADKTCYTTTTTTEATSGASGARGGSWAAASAALLATSVAAALRV